MSQAMDYVGSVVGILSPLIKFGWDVHGRFGELGELAQELEKDTEKMVEQLEVARDFALDNPEKLDPKLQHRLRTARVRCQETLEKVNQCIEAYESWWRRLKKAVFSDKEIEGLQKMLRKCTKELKGIDRDGHREISAAIQDELAWQRETPALGPLPADDVPANTPEHVRKVLIEGRCVDERDPDGFTPLHIACALGNAPLVKLLLERGARAGVRTANLKDTALHIAAFSGHADVLRAIERHFTRKRGGQTTLGGEEEERRKESRREREQSEKQKWKDLVQSVNKKGCLPLHTAAKQGKVSSAQRLIDALKSIDGPTPLLDMPDGRGRTPLHIAARNGWTEMVGLLITEGANPRMKDDDGLEPLGLAQKHKHEECATLLEEAPVTLQVGAPKPKARRVGAKEQKNRVVKERDGKSLGEMKTKDATGLKVKTHQTRPRSRSRTAAKNKNEKRCEKQAEAQEPRTRRKRRTRDRRVSRSRSTGN